MHKGEEDVHVILDGQLAALLAKIDPEIYQKYAQQRKRQAYIYCCVNVIMYGTLKAALLFWKQLFSSLKQCNFIINPYDWCVANKTSMETYHCLPC